MMKDCKLMIFHQIYCRKCDLFFMAKTMKAPCTFCGKTMLAVYHKDNIFNIFENVKMENRKDKTCNDCTLCIPVNERHLDPYNSVCNFSLRTF